MPEYPEIRNLAQQMDGALRGKRITGVEVANEKCLNLSVENFSARVVGRTIEGAHWQGKWCFLRLGQGDRLALNLNMGGNVVLYPPGQGPREKWRVVLRFADGDSLSVGFWFLGYLHWIGAGEPHPMTDKLGADPLADDFTFERFQGLLAGRKLPIKGLLLKQEHIAGIGNYYIQDILFQARLHPMRAALSLTVEEQQRLYDAIRDRFALALAQGGAWYENDLYDEPGRFREMLIGYKEGQPCPQCHTPIQKIKTGSTSGFVCPVCQPLQP